MAAARTEENGGSSVFSHPLEYSNYLCQACVEEGRNEESEWYCTDCQEFLCQDCYKVHIKPRAIRHHVLVDKASVRLMREQNAAQNIINYTCSRHRGKLAEYFCPIHDELSCMKCVTKKHSKCYNVLSISEEFAGIKPSGVYKDVCMALDSIDTKSQEVIDTTKKTITTVNSVCQTTVQLLKQFRDEINNVLDNFENSVTMQAEHIRDRDLEKLNSVIEESSTIHREIQDIRSEIGNLESNNMFDMLSIAAVKAGSRVKELQSKFTDLGESQNNLTQYTFLPNMRLIDSLRDPQRLGGLIPDPGLSRGKEQTNAEILHAARCKTEEAMALKTAQTTPSDTAESTMKKRRKAIYQNRFQNLKAAYLKEIVISTDSDSTEHHCLISGIALLGNKLVVADNGNGKVKLVSVDSNKVTDTIDTLDSPWDIACVDEHKVAVTIPDMQMIVFLEVNEKLVRAGDVTVRGNCHGISFCNDALVVSFTQPAKIEILDLTGSVLQVVYLDKEGEKLFLSPENIAVSSNGHIIFVSDREKNCVTSVTKDGVVDRRYKIYEFSESAQLTVVSRDVVLVCGWDSHNIHVLHSNCDSTRILLTQYDGIWFPQSIYYCPDMDRLYVGMSENKIRVFQL